MRAPDDLTNTISHWRVMLSAVPPEARLRLFEDAADDVAKFVSGGSDRAEIADKLDDLAVQVGDGLNDVDARQRIIAAAIQQAVTGPPGAALSAAQWLDRYLEEPDVLLGHWFTTTSRVLLFGPTGIGKTMFVTGMAVACGGGSDSFLHWKVRRPAKVLLIDGEMSRRLMKERLRDEVSRVGGVIPEGLYILSHEDIEGFAPLNTPEGQAQIEREIERLGGVDALLFDNVMSLISGNQKDEDGWRDTMPWVRSLTKRRIGQMWIHHTGHDEEKSYGTKIREWQMDTVLKLQRPGEAKHDVDFQLLFPKARERNPATRADFVNVNVALVEDQWTVDGAPRPVVGKKLTDAHAEFYDHVCNIVADLGEPLVPEAGMPSVRGIARKVTRSELVRKGWFHDGQLSEGGKLSESAYTDENNALRALKRRGFLGYNRDYMWLMRQFTFRHFP